jgi:hypothetical protein
VAPPGARVATASAGSGGWQFVPDCCGVASASAALVVRAAGDGAQATGSSVAATAWSSRSRARTANWTPANVT